MQDLAGKTAFITGGASGIGLALGRAAAEAGMRVMLADIEAEALAGAVAGLRDIGPEIRGTVCDVADPASVERAAEATFAAFGHVHLLCNNAGVGAGSGIETISLDTWRWVIDVNLMGVLHGIRFFLPHMRAHGESGHIVNTSSMAGLTSGFGFSPYATSKAAIISMSEGLARQLAPLGIGVSVLCPGFVKTRIPEAARNRQPRYGAATSPEPGSPGANMLAELARLTESGLDPKDVAAQVLDAVRDDTLYIFTHTSPNWRAELTQRFDAILAAMDTAAAGQKAKRRARGSAPGPR